ncbi:PIN domain-containing protein [Synechocystis salina LEGE 06099]|uniref:type II toxin-antitoxin system VapC family toxin n=1 Tax=Synechocystis salina TaxID=945780 RepID=UPI00187E5B72|nr:PIN domain-containing protein [Synechocystis salina]MBE9204895.1 PIN domain-containing protein [Synechocystis salina LEGE 06099]
MIYLDTHIVVWLYSGFKQKLSPTAQSLINQHDLYISPIVRLELQYLYEIQRITVLANVMIEDLELRLNLIICDRQFDQVISQSLDQNWTRDPFDRIIVSQAALQGSLLLTKDKNIRDNYPQAQW